MYKYKGRWKARHDLIEIGFSSMVEKVDDSEMQVDDKQYHMVHKSPAS